MPRLTVAARIAHVGVVLLLGLSAFLLLVSLAAPLTEHLRIESSQTLYWITRTFCHQLPTRCIWLFHSNMAVCSHCLGILLGVFTASALHLARTGRIFFGLAGTRYLKINFLFCLSVFAFLLEVFLQYQHPSKLHPHVVRVIFAFGPAFFGTLWLFQTVLKLHLTTRGEFNGEESGVTFSSLTG